jgi:hypothetical protein
MVRRFKSRIFSSKVLANILRKREEKWRLEEERGEMEIRKCREVSVCVFVRSA